LTQARSTKIGAATLLNTFYSSIRLSLRFLHALRMTSVLMMPFPFSLVLKMQTHFAGDTLISLLGILLLEYLVLLSLYVCYNV